MLKISKVPVDVLARKLYAEVKLNEQPTQFARNQFQTATFQKSVIQHYARLGRLHEVYYYVQMELPRSLRPDPNERYFMPATYPVGFIPVFCADPDPARARRMAYELCLQFRQIAVGRDLFFEVVITDENALRNDYWYRWGDIIWTEVDKVCPWCGQVYQTMADVPVVAYDGDDYFYAVVCDCSVPNGPNSALVHQLSAYVDGTIYTTVRFPLADKT